MKVGKRLNTLTSKRQSYSDKIFNSVNFILMLVLLVVFAWPLWFVVIASFSDPTATELGKVILWPVDISVRGYLKMREYPEIWTGYANTIFYTVAGTFINMVMSICLAYPMSDRTFRIKKPVMVYLLICMYFSGGLIPSYLLLKGLGMVNTIWAIIGTGACSIYNSLIIRAYFENSIPVELKDASDLDGADAAQYLWYVILPLSKPVFAVVGLYYMVANWNNYTKALYYVYNRALYPLQSVLREMLMSSKLLLDVMDDPELAAIAAEEAQLLKYSVIIIASLPVLCVYPFIQKYFVKGMMVGSLKG